MGTVLVDRVQQLFKKHHDATHGVINVAGVMKELGQEAPNGISPNEYVTSTFRTMLEDPTYAPFHGPAQIALCGQIAEGYVTDHAVFALVWDYGHRMDVADRDIPDRTLRSLVICKEGCDWLKNQLPSWESQPGMKDWHDYARELIGRKQQLLERKGE